MSRGSLGNVENLRRPDAARSRGNVGATLGAGKASARLGGYLRQLREGYGYTLRKVEERAMALGESIDNSQLSRFEKGKAVPSFEKLRALARVFNVSVQNFSDVLDLEEYEAFRPETDEYAELIRCGDDLFKRGEHGRAFVAYEKAFDVATGDRGSRRTSEEAYEARWRMACSLKALGKLSMAEHELRSILKEHRVIGPGIRMNGLLQLAYIHRERGDHFIASVLARECLQLAEEQDDSRVQAGVLNTLGSIHFDDGAYPEALEYYERALDVLDRLPGHAKLRAMALTELGGCLVAVDRFDEGVRMLREAHARAREAGFRRVAALSMSRTGEAFLQQGDHDQAKACFTESDCLASRSPESYHDILFLNAFRRWQIARQEGNGTREKIAFGRLRHLRSLIQSRFAEVDEFDRHVERNRRSHVY
jgi:tetratricopeptide (TPR) repeat protein